MRVLLIKIPYSSYTVDTTYIHGPMYIQTHGKATLYKRIKSSLIYRLEVAQINPRKLQEFSVMFAVCL